MKLKKLSQKEKLNNEKILYSSPFYGIKGSISKITESGNYFLVTRYGVNGEDGEILPTPKKQKKELQKEYINDIKRYLEKNNTKYLTNLNNQSKTKISKKKIVGLTTGTVTLVIASILGAIFTVNTTSYLCITTFFFSFIATCHEIHLLKECLSEEKRQKFIHNYKKYVDTLNNYNMQDMINL